MKKFNSDKETEGPNSDRANCIISSSVGFITLPSLNLCWIKEVEQVCFCVEREITVCDRLQSRTERTETCEGRALSQRRGVDEPQSQTDVIDDLLTSDGLHQPPSASSSSLSLLLMPSDSHYCWMSSLCCHCSLVQSEADLSSNAGDRLQTKRWFKFLYSSSLNCRSDTTDWHTDRLTGCSQVSRYSAVLNENTSNSLN